MDSSPHYRDARAEVHRLVVGPIDNNVWFVRCRATGRAAMVDAANEAGVLLARCRELGVGPVLQTHGHWDHVQAVPEMRAAGFRVGVAAADAPMVEGHDFTLDDGATVEVGRLTLEVVATPGHTPGSLCFLLHGSPVLLSGDTLFPGGPGATRLPGSSFEQIMRSIDERLFATLGDETLVLPGHGADTTIGAERPRLAEWAARGW